MRLERETRHLRDPICLLVAGEQASRRVGERVCMLGQFHEPPDSPMRHREGLHSSWPQPSQLTSARFFWSLITSSDHTREIDLPRSVMPYAVM